MSEEGSPDGKRRKKRRRSSKSYKPMRESVIIFTMFITLTGVIVVCLWVIIPNALRYLRHSLGW
ncbi:MAG: hypothetical protein M2R45_03330 [Verrucomicrobia subdivision 3 bacterium]|nr:hypothetical protein [Limisphaerales bacterium]